MPIGNSIRVLYFDHTATLSGGEIALLNVILQLDRDHVTPIVVLGSDGPLVDALRPIARVHIIELLEAIRVEKKDGLGVGSLLRIRQVFQIARYINELRCFIRQNDIDIVHTNSLKADIIGGIAARLAFIPVLWHVRDRIADDYLPPTVAKVFRWLARVIPTFVIANSKATLTTLQLSSGHTRVVHDGTLLPELLEARADRPLLQVGLIGRISPWKGQDIFLRAAALVKSKFPNVRFQIVGSALFGEKQYESQVRALCTQLQLDSVVTFAGFRSDIPAVLEDLDIVVHASTTGEPFGQVIIEGMAAGKPVVATNGGGVPEIVEHNQTGILIPMKDPVAMSDAICRLLANRAERVEMGRKGWERVRDKFTLSRVALEIESVYSVLFPETELRPISQNPHPSFRAITTSIHVGKET